MALLTIVIGIVFILLLFSLLATTIMELIANLLSLRGKHLLEAISDMIGSTKDSFVQHPFFQQLTIGSNLRVNGRALPSYISSWNFSAILLDILDMSRPEQIQSKIDSLPAGKLKELMVFFYKQTGDDLQAFKTKMEDWFNEVMDRASGAYKRKTRMYLLFVGLVLALTFNVDVITIYNSLSVNATLRDFVASEANNFVNNNPNITAATTSYTEAREKIGVLVNSNIAAISSPLGLGWESVDWSKVDFRWWLYHIAGWITTALSVSLGATFWFDLLRKLVGIKGSGPAPASQLPSENAQAQRPMTTSQIPGGSFLTTPGKDSPLESIRMAQAPPAPEMEVFEQEEEPTKEEEGKK